MRVFTEEKLLKEAFCIYTISLVRVEYFETFIYHNFNHKCEKSVGLIQGKVIPNATSVNC